MPSPTARRDDTPRQPRLRTKRWDTIGKRTERSQTLKSLLATDGPESQAAVPRLSDGDDS
jgi:hypothetical protein